MEDGGQDCGKYRNYGESRGGNCTKGVAVILKKAYNVRKNVTIRRNCIMKKRMAGMLALLSAVAITVTGCSVGNTPDYSKEAINVAGVSVPLKEVNFLLRYQQTQMQSFYGMFYGEDYLNQDLMGTGAPYGNTMRDGVVEMLGDYYVVEAHAEELGISLSEEEKTKASEAAKAFLAANNSKTLNAMSADETTVTHVLELMALQAKVYDDRAATIDTEVNQEEAAQKRISYVINSTSGELNEAGEEVPLSEEEIANKRSEMDALLQEAKAGQGLAAAAEAKGLSCNEAVNYGKDDTSLLTEIKNAADALQDGEYSEVIETTDGYGIVYMESTFDEAATQNEIQDILSQRESEAYTAWLDPLKEAANITTSDEAIGLLTFERIFSEPAAEEEDTPDESEETTPDETEETQTEEGAETQTEE